MERDTRRLALISVGLGIAIVTLMPTRAGLIHAFHPGMHGSPWRNLLVTDAFDVVQNILLYLPLGYLAAAAVTAREGGADLPGTASASAMERGRVARAWARRRLLRAGLLGFGFSLLLEGIQFWIPGRFCSAFDVLTNGTGAWLGGLAALAAPIVLDPIFSDPV
jgi:VanZ like protein